jgi:cytochrome b involved in lipid metabolism
MNMTKNIVTVSLVLFIAVVIVILGGAVFFQQNKPSSNIPAVTNPVNETNNITLVELANHNSSSDCWVIVNDKVYNVTNYLPMHPAGLDKITPYCGSDATVAFETRSGRGSHSPRAQSVLDTYFIGNLGK